MAEERFPCRRPPSMLATRSDNVMLRAPAISLRPLQNASSRLTLVLCPAMTIERLTTGDFIDRPPYRHDARRVRGGPSLLAPLPAHAWPSSGHGQCGSPQRERLPPVVLPPYEPVVD